MSTPKEDRTGSSAGAAHDRPVIEDDTSAYFDSRASYWDEVYSDTDLQGRIYRRRQAGVLGMVDAAALSPGASALEIGSGAGHLTVELARRGLDVHAIDVSEAMVEATARQAHAAGLAHRVSTSVGDIEALSFSDESCDVVVAVGVIPWVDNPRVGIAEALRVLKPGGQLVLTVDNKRRLVVFTDPRELLAQTPLRRVYHAVRGKRGLVMSRLDSPRRIDRWLRERGAAPQERCTVGFGPITLLGRPVIASRAALRVDARLQRWADRGAPLVCATGWHYVVRARKR